MSILARIRIRRTVLQDHAAHPGTPAAATLAGAPATMAWYQYTVDVPVRGMGAESLAAEFTAATARAFHAPSVLPPLVGGVSAGDSTAAGARECDPEGQRFVAAVLAVGVMVVEVWWMWSLTLPAGSRAALVTTLWSVAFMFTAAFAAFAPFKSQFETAHHVCQDHAVALATLAFAFAAGTSGLAHWHVAHYRASAHSALGMVVAVLAMSVYLCQLVAAPGWAHQFLELLGVESHSDRGFEEMAETPESQMSRHRVLQHVLLATNMVRR